MTATRRTLPRESFKPAFVVGVTGDMDLDPAHREATKAEVKQIFDWLRASPGKKHKKQNKASLGPGLGLKNTPIVHAYYSTLVVGAKRKSACRRSGQGIPESGGFVRACCQNSPSAGDRERC